ncbi:MAG: isoprenyl transferase [Rhizobiales bacterium]|nr:isoprenyl transferase [Hyphomicrobiales bacterium]
MAEEAIAEDKAAFDQIDRTSLPCHVAIIMDGNGRWAGKRNLPRAVGHRNGIEAVRRTVRAAGELAIPYLTIYGFSSENWSRPEAEINHLMDLLKRFIKQDLAALHRNNVRIRVIGEEFRLDPEVVSLIKDAQQLTAENTGLQLIAAFNYGARNEIARAAHKIALEVEAGRLSADAIGVDEFERHLDTAGIPDPDLLIRTSGEQRLSNFLLWQTAYTELVFTDVLWPDFDAQALCDAIAIYQNRERRFGDVTARSAC